MFDLTFEDEFKLLSDELGRIFSSNFLDELAKTHKFKQRKGKLEPLDFVSLCSFFNEGSGIKSLSRLCALLTAQRKVSLSTEGLNQRFNKNAVNMMKEIFRHLFSRQILKNKISELDAMGFSRIRILDSSSFEIPTMYEGDYLGCTKNKSGVKLQLEYELLTGSFLHLEVQNGRNSDQKYGPTLLKTIKKNDLIIRDLGYFNVEELYQIGQKDAYYLTRLKPPTTLFTKEDGSYIKLNLAEVMDEMEEGEIREIVDIYVTAKKHHIPRLILYKLTPEQIKKREKKREKTEKKRGVKLSHPTKRLYKLNMFITNIPCQSVPKEEIHLFYSLRWQIEILFKTWKSLFQIHKVKKMKMERFECHLYGTLISLLISSTIAFQAREYLLRKKKRETSEYKSISIIMEFIPTLFEAIIFSPTSILDILNRIYSQIEKNGKKSHRKKKLTVFDIMKVSYERTIGKATKGSA
ncbi:IS4 family transposase [Bacillus sp. B15-48]|uniref:IS4 family transposase n=1 Tax=Bacillus sp. B15-48 TaxID=1548601 RepID=UPI00193ED1CD|nr:IS4 family transposase [Bacillus sp. B15-48]MBM4763085.1 IS4 family transposase [Bacillus sp. B15-48]